MILFEGFEINEGDFILFESYNYIITFDVIRVTNTHVWIRSMKTKCTWIIKNEKLFNMLMDDHITLIKKEEYE